MGNVPTVGAPSAVRLRYPRAPEVITVPAEPGTAPPPTWSAMSTGLDDATRPACSWLSPLAPYPDADGRSGVCHRTCLKPGSAPTPPLFARADAARVMSPPIALATRPPLDHDGCEEGSSHRAKRPMRNASGGIRSRWSLLQCGLRSSVKSNVAGNADAAPNP